MSAVRAIAAGHDLVAAAFQVSRGDGIEREATAREALDSLVTARVVMGPESHLSRVRSYSLVIQIGLDQATLPSSCSTRT